MHGAVVVQRVAAFEPVGLIERASFLSPRAATNVPFGRVRMRGARSRWKRVGARSSLEQCQLLVLPAVASVAGMVSGCTEFAPADERLQELQQEVDSVAAAGAAAMDETITAEGAGTADWSCLGQPDQLEPVRMVDEAVPVDLSMVIRSFTGAIIDDVSVDVCGAVDVNCMFPLEEGLTTGETGQILLPMFQGYSGFLQVISDGFISTVFHVRRPVWEDRQDPRPILLLPQQALLPLAMASNVEYRNELAIAGVSVVDCSGQRAPDVEFRNSVGGLSFYVVDGLPSASATTTDSFGLGGFLNVPAGVVTFEAYETDQGRFIGRRAVTMRAEWATITEINPRLR